MVILGSSVVLYLCSGVSVYVFTISSIFPLGIVLSISGTIDIFWKCFDFGGKSFGFIIFPYSVIFFFISFFDNYYGVLFYNLFGGNI